MGAHGPAAVLAGPGSWQALSVALAGGAEEVLGVVEELLEALIVQLVAALPRPGDCVEVEGGAANSTSFPLGNSRRVIVSGVEAVCQACLKQGVHPGGLVQLFLRGGAKIRSRLAVLASVPEPTREGRNGLNRNLANSTVDLLEDLKGEI